VKTVSVLLGLDDLQPCAVPASELRSAGFLVVSTKELYCYMYICTHATQAAQQRGHRDMWNAGQIHLKNFTYEDPVRAYRTAAIGERVTKIK